MNNVISFMESRMQRHPKKLKMDLHLFWIPKWMRDFAIHKYRELYADEYMVLVPYDNHTKS